MKLPQWVICSDGKKGLATRKSENASYCTLWYWVEYYHLDKNLQFGDWYAEKNLKPVFMEEVIEDKNRTESFAPTKEQLEKEHWLAQNKQALVHWSAVTRARAEELRLIGLDKAALTLLDIAHHIHKGFLDNIL